MAADRDHARFWRVEVEEKGRNGGFTGTRGPDNRCRGVERDGKREFIQNLGVWPSRVRKCYVLESNGGRQRG